MARPHAIPREMICSECGLDWDLHPEDARRRDCIKLLKLEIPLYPVRWSPNQYSCNWGHLNCYIVHYSGGWGTFQTDTYRITGMSSTVTNTGGASVAYIFPAKDDDPDMGVTADAS